MSGLLSSKLLVLILSAGLVACAGEDKKDNPKNSDGDKVEDEALALNGFWDGGLNQKDTLRVLIYNGDVYGLDEDKGFFGTVASPQEEEVDFKLTSYPFSYEDKPNNEFVADGVATEFTINGLLAAKTSVVGEFSTSGSEFGSIALKNDETYANNSSLATLAGKWTTTDLELNITSRGKFLGFTKAEDKDCSFEGQLEIINASNSLLSMTINRRNCDEFNGEAKGFAAVNGDKELELYSKLNDSLLFMKFKAPAAATPETPAEGGNDTPAEGDAETPAP